MAQRSLFQMVSRSILPPAVAVVLVVGSLLAGAASASGEEAAAGHYGSVADLDEVSAKANVDVQLQAVWCSGGSCNWRTVDTKSDNVYAGGGSGNRAAVRENCAGSTTVGWRLRVDVDLIGVADPSGWTNSAGKDLACYPSS
ncbi:hypothetical protein IFT73_17920 [Aeromicrobium sp. CFBP 8757]|uniref:hypothetical protein n=1 Tax=Aeromicrobium sp. CFBP 8757 TaxID=2775288 RepID=UPI001780F40C|nr:hypothetical protein [Aeromicrobium sp. CFBP 8757]MBD8608736.1 hypothetical protein [Aeromicrobium sp. CFBP 8757]